MTTDVQTIFEKESIIPDILAPGTKVPRNLKVIWPNAKLEKPGQMIERDATQPQPTLFVEPSPEDKESQPIYTLLMVDPDLTHRIFLLMLVRLRFRRIISLLGMFRA
ncbi:hypothetical protein DTO166G4_8588 [Paecilomyces variotii]|nr:hypothetical protein DTO166G4_8588 [Paecilomyces variotii]KAJ9249698.1 hypothetical protein DTO195F2_8435 [Paecilomyces variotii]